MFLKKPNKIIIMEDHDKAYYFWKESGVKGKTLIHIDAHIDFAMLPDMDLNEVNIDNLQGLDYLLKNQPLWNPFLKERRKMVHIGNYIFPAIKEGLVNKVYWVVPDPTWESFRSLRYIQKQISPLLKIKRYININLKIFKDYLYFRIFDTDFFVYSLNNLPSIRENVLLDIDVDFLLTPYIWRDLGPDRVPWIWPQELFGKVVSKDIDTDILTISYSVQGGFTPLEYKYFGDELRFLFENSFNEKMEKISQLRKKALFLEQNQKYNEAINIYEEILKIKEDASSYYKLALLYLNNGTDYTRAKYLYQKAVQLDKTYSAVFGSYDIISIYGGKLKKAEEELNKFLELDNSNIYFLNGLAFVALNQKKYKKAENYFKQILDLNKTAVFACLGIGIVYFKTGRLKEAEESFLKLQENSSEYSEIYWWLAQIAEKKKEFQRAIDLYREAVLSGDEGPMVHFLLLRLYLRKRFYLRASEEAGRIIKLWIS